MNKYGVMLILAVLCLDIGLVVLSRTRLEGHRQEHVAVQLNGTIVESREVESVSGNLQTSFFLWVKVTYQGQSITRQLETPIITRTLESFEQGDEISVWAVTGKLSGLRSLSYYEPVDNMPFLINYMTILFLFLSWVFPLTQIYQRRRQNPCGFFDRPGRIFSQDVEMQGSNKIIEVNKHFILTEKDPPLIRQILMQAK